MGEVRGPHDRSSSTSDVAHRCEERQIVALGHRLEAMSLDTGILERSGELGRRCKMEVTEKL